MSDIERYLSSTGKAELMEKLAEELESSNSPKVIIVLLDSKQEKDGYSVLPMLLNIDTTYEAVGILDVAKHDLLHYYDEEADA